MDDLYIVDADQLRALEAIAKRLFTENRMNGDEMRDAAQAIAAIVRRAREIPVEA